MKQKQSMKRQNVIIVETMNNRLLTGTQFHPIISWSKILLFGSAFHNSFTFYSTHRTEQTPNFNSISGKVINTQFWINFTLSIFIWFVYKSQLIYYTLKKKGKENKKWSNGQTASSEIKNVIYNYKFKWFAHCIPTLLCFNLSCYAHAFGNILVF